MIYAFKSRNIVPVSLNQLYKGIHWADRVKYKDQWRAEFSYGHDKKYHFEKPVHVAYVFGMKKPMDCSNLAFMIKLIEDSLTQAKVIQDDTPKYVHAITSISFYHPENLVLVYITDEGALPTYTELIEMAK